MIVKEATESIKIKQLRIMLKRSSPDFLFRKEMESEMARSLAGYQGEKSMDFHLDLLPKDDTFIFHDLRIPYGSSHFQIDILILTTFFFLIIEVKNMSGRLLFDQEFHQLIRIYKGMEETFSDPISQLYRQTFLLKEWLKQLQLPSIPIESLVIISNPHTRIDTISEINDISKLVTHSSNLLPRFHKYQNTYKEEKISKKEIKKLSRHLLKQHSTKTPDLFKQFSMTENDLLKGVACPKCLVLPMVWQKHGSACNVDMLVKMHIWKR
ncbi:nuclease-related domain-containing protein [Fictibacillus barbaricus]|uniref:NERD domain-containing protein n=1 Tax=Fictibacillus barbaricus TaxID=182136 RepID=A0ABS2ZG57_9BACL|nr:nuclease-related domain-containing protein [Fictibacillus barbaricus]MBN3546642.1 NERD domain-containing protein [Fictibacillus barbaricus]GGB42627.1 nuclease [Fictibacillus barbaricus]